MRKRPANPISTLSHSNHTLDMRTQALRKYLAYVYPLVLLIAWAILILVALHVSEIVLKTLDMIVELAAISP